MSLPTDILLLISSYCEELPLRLHPELEWNIGLLENPDAIDLIQEYIHKKEIDFVEAKHLIKNPNPIFLSMIDFDLYPELIADLCGHHSHEAMEKVETFAIEQWDGAALSSNPYAIRLLEQHPEKIQLYLLGDNPNGYDLFRRELQKKSKSSIYSYIVTAGGIHGEKIRKDFPILSSMVEWYSNIRAWERPEILDNPGDMSEWIIEGLCSNPSPKAEIMLLQWLEVNQPFENMIWLCGARWPRLIERLGEQYPDEIVPEILSSNPAAIDYLLDNLHCVRWDSLAHNPSDRVLEVVLAYKYSFLAAVSYNERMYKRKEVLIVDEKEFHRRLKEKVKILSQY